MNEPKRHHFVPQMLLRRFSNEGGKLAFFDKRIADKGVLESSPKDLFAKRHLYSRLEKNGTKDTALEKYFAEIEGTANLLIDKIVAAASRKQLPEFSEAEKHGWDTFFYHQWSRVPDLHLGLLNDFPQALKRSIEEHERNVRPLTGEVRASLEEPKTL